MRIQTTHWRSVAELVFVEKTCDICGARSHMENWGNGIDTELLTTVELRRRPLTETGPAALNTTFDICPDCFEDRLIPWLGSLGAEPQTARPGTLSQ